MYISWHMVTIWITCFRLHSFTLSTSNLTLCLFEVLAVPTPMITTMVPVLYVCVSVLLEKSFKSQPHSTFFLYKIHCICWLRINFIKSKIWKLPALLFFIYSDEYLHGSTCGSLLQNVEPYVGSKQMKCQPLW